MHYPPSHGSRWCQYMRASVEMSDIPVLTSVCERCVGATAWKLKNATESQREEKNTQQANSNRKYKLILKAGCIPLKFSHPWLPFWLPSAGYYVPEALWLIVPIIQVWKFNFCRLYWKTKSSRTPSGNRYIRWPMTKIIWQIESSYRKDDGKTCHWKKK